MAGQMKKILVIGATGQIGSELVSHLREDYGENSVIGTYNNTDPSGDLLEGPMEKLDVLNAGRIGEVVDKYEVDSVFHLAAILSAKGESNPQLAFKVNVMGTFNVLEVGRKQQLNRIVIPSSIGVFGPEVPREKAPNETVLRPTSMYGVTKVTGELLGNYYFNKYGLDVRGARFPGIISYKTLPGGGTTDYAVEAFYKAIEDRHYSFFVREDTRLPLMYMPDCTRALIELAQADLEDLNYHADYNVSSLSFSARDLAEAIRKRIPEFSFDFQPDKRQEIADSWPNSMDDTPARKDWGWQPRFGLEEMTDDMIDKLKEKLDEHERK